MNLKGRARIGAAALAAAMSLTLAACGTESTQNYTNQQQQEVLEVEQRAKGDIDLNFSVPPTLENKGADRIEGIAGIVDFGNTGVLAINKEKTQLFRIINGSVVWSSEISEEPIVDAKLVQEGDRAWIVSTKKKGDDLDISVYDSYAHLSEQLPLRKKTVDNGRALVFRDGVIIADDTGVYKYSAHSGMISKINLPGGSVLLAPTAMGYLISQNDQVGVASNEEDGGWNSLNVRPEGFSTSAKNSVVAFSPSIVALKWTEGSRSKITFINTKTGDLISEYDGNLSGNIGKTIQSADSAPIVFVDNVALDIFSKKIQVFDHNITGIIDDIAYLEDGSGYDFQTGNPAWSADLNGINPSLIFQRQGLYFQDNSLTLVNVKYVPAPPEQASVTATPVN